MPLAARWRLLDSGAADGATNMAIDHALLDRAAQRDEAVLRIYAWARPTLSLGLHERARVSPEALAAHGVDVVRRPTGGRALLHHREVTYSVTAPVTGLGLHETFRAINGLLIAALTGLGVRATEAARTKRAASPDGSPCFAEPNLGELVVDGHKLVGSAQRRDAGALLQHGSILLADDQPLITRIRAYPNAPPDGPLDAPPDAAPDALPNAAQPALPAAATLESALGRAVTYAEVRDALVRALRANAGENVADLDPRSLDEGIACHHSTYRSADWTWRR